MTPNPLKGALDNLSEGFSLRFCIDQWHSLTIFVRKVVTEDVWEGGK